MTEAKKVHLDYRLGRAEIVSLLLEPGNYTELWIDTDVVGNLTLPEHSDNMQIIRVLEVLGFNLEDKYVLMALMWPLVRNPKHFGLEIEDVYNTNYRGAFRTIFRREQKI
jgi:hypothetical protein